MRILASRCARMQRAVHFGMQKADVVIAGGGAVGSATAYFLLNQADFSGSIMVIEPDPTYAFAASALSASSIRPQFSTPLNIALSAFGLEFLRDCGRGLADVNLVESTYLYLASAQGEATLKQNVDATAVNPNASANLVPVFLLDQGPIAAVLPAVPSDGLIPFSTLGGQVGGPHLQVRDSLAGVRDADDAVYVRPAVRQIGNLVLGLRNSLHCEHRPVGA